MDFSLNFDTTTQFSLKFSSTLLKVNTVYGKRSFFSKESDTLRSYRELKVNMLELLTQAGEIHNEHQAFES